MKRSAEVKQPANQPAEVKQTVEVTPIIEAEKPVEEKKFRRTK